MKQNEEENPRSSKMASHIVEYRLVPKRELKLAQEYFWDGKSSAVDLQKLEADLRESFRKLMGIEYISSNTFSCYDQAAALKGSDHRRATKVSDDDYVKVKAIEEIKKKIFSANAAAQALRKSSPRGQRCGVPKLFGIEETKGDRDPINNTEEEIGISPPANNRSPRPMLVKISRSRRPKTMRVKITVNSREYIALIDTGSTYNVLHPRVAGEMGLKIIHDDPIEVRIADGSIMRSEGSCPEFKFEIQEGQFATEAYILQLGGFDVILGIEWLMGLGQIKNWDFASLKMELKQGGKTIQIKGMDTEESEEGCSTDEKLVSMVRAGVKYGAGIVYDIHSPRVPSTEEIADGINMMLAVLETIQVNPDGGLKTRKYTEVKPALKNKLLRSQLVSAK